MDFLGDFGPADAEHLLGDAARFWIELDLDREAALPTIALPQRPAI